MIVTLIRKTSSGAQLRLDADALHVLSAVLEFTSRLNPRCKELAHQFEPLFVRAALPHESKTEEQRSASSK
jgi:hypothetical protein